MFPNQPSHDYEANAILNSLLLRLESVIAETRKDAGALPHFVVESRLREKLLAELPGVKFTASDIQAWASSMSS